MPEDNFYRHTKCKKVARHHSIDLIAFAQSCICKSDL